MTAKRGICRWRQHPKKKRPFSPGEGARTSAPRSEMSIPGPHIGVLRNKDDIERAQQGSLRMQHLQFRDLEIDFGLHLVAFRRYQAADVLQQVVRGGHADAEGFAFVVQRGGGGIGRNLGSLCRLEVGALPRQDCSTSSTTL